MESKPVKATNLKQLAAAGVLTGGQVACGIGGGGDGGDTVGGSLGRVAATICLSGCCRQSSLEATEQHLQQQIQEGRVRCLGPGMLGWFRAQRTYQTMKTCVTRAAGRQQQTKQRK